GPEHVANARMASYPAEIAAQVPPERLRRFFRKVSGGYQVCKAVREVCVFAEHNVAKDPPFSNLDFLSARNLVARPGLIGRERLLAILRFALKSKGFALFSRAAPELGATELFEAVDESYRLYVPTAASGKARLWSPPRDGGPNGDSHDGEGEAID